MADNKKAFKGKVISVSLKSVSLPDGRKTALELVEHPGASLIVPVLDTGSLLILRQFRPAISKYIYEFPAGTRRKGESYLACARRELKEETGLAAASFKCLGKIYPVPGYSTEKIAIFRADGAVKRALCLRDPDELMESVVVTVKQLKALVHSGGIADAKTICALALMGI